MNENIKKIRIDRWLNAARFYKTRSQAAKACKGGKIKINGKRVKPHKSLNIGDHITIHTHGRYRDITVESLADRGLPAKEAQELYYEEEKMNLSEEDQQLIKVFKKSHKKKYRKKQGRPTKKERRTMDKLKQQLYGLDDN
ncbi:MAG: RNA-binding S4 domain-containing protein [bacterium]